MNSPRVFEEGTVTLVLGPGGCTVYAGAKEIGMFESVAADSGQESGRPSVEIRFGKSHDQDVAMRIEESARTAKTISWVRVVR